jgi:YfiH family protein
MLMPDPVRGARLRVSPLLLRLPRVVHGFTTLALGDGAGTGGGTTLDAALGPDDASAWRRHAARQVHGASVVPASEATTSREPPEADALWTDAAGSLLVIRTADCVPVLLAALAPPGSPGAGEVHTVAAVHAGWRGLVAGVLPAAVGALEQRVPAARVVAALGPAIGPCCFEIGPDVEAALRQLGDPEALRPGTGDRSFADLPRLARFQLAASGATCPGGDGPCTRCSSDFPSWRRDATPARLLSYIGLRARS